MIHQVLLIHYVLIDEPFPLRHIFGMLPIVPIFGWQQDAKLWRDVDEQQLPIHSLFLSAKTPPAIFADAAMLPPTRPSMALLESCTYFKSESFALPLSLSLSLYLNKNTICDDGGKISHLDDVHFFSVGHSLENCRNWSDETVALIILILVLPPHRIILPQLQGKYGHWNMLWAWTW